MANPLPPPPIKSPDGSYAWLDWYNKLQQYVSQGGSIPWATIDFTGSNLSDIQNKPHNVLTAIQGGTVSEFYHLTAAQHANAIIAVPNTRTLTAGTGLTGGGDLSADRTFNVVANADGSILANANDIQVGVLATDAQHGNRGGGSLHANATTSTAGFMSAADKTRLDGIATSCFRAYQSSGQAISATTTTIVQFQTEDFDDLGEYSTSTYEFVPGVAGKYIFAAGVFGGQAAATDRLIMLYVNGSERVRMQQTSGDKGQTTIAGTSGVVSLSASDVVTLRYFTGIAETLTTGSAITYFSGYRVK